MSISPWAHYILFVFEIFFLFKQSCFCTVFIVRPENRALERFWAASVIVSVSFLSEKLAYILIIWVLDLYPTETSDRGWVFFSFK